MAPRISVKQFGRLFHGTGATGLTEIDQSQGNVNYSSMPRIWGWNFATNTLQTAIDYARTTKGKGTPTVYDVSPKRASDAWGPDPDSGAGGWNDGPRNKREALDIHENGGDISLRFNSPLKVNREVWQEDKAKDVTSAHMWLNRIPTDEEANKRDHWGYTPSDRHTMGRSFT